MSSGLAAAVLGIVIGGVFVVPLVPLLRSCSPPVAAAALGIAMLGVAIFSVDLGSVVDVLDQSGSLGFSSIVLAVIPGALGGAALLAVAAVVATLDARRGRT